MEQEVFAMTLTANATTTGSLGIPKPGPSLALAVAWSWAWWGISIAAGGTETAAGALTYLIGGFGPTLGVFYYLRGRSHAYRSDFRRRLFNWRVAPVFWGLALAFAVGPKLVSLGIAALGGHTASGEAIGLADVPFALVFTLVAIWIEEPLWRGTALDAFGSNLVKAALVIGLVWSVWHIPLFAVDGTFQEDELGLGTVDFLLFLIGIVGLSVFLTWIVGRTGSILIALFTHMAINLNGMLLPDDTTIRAGEITVILLIAAALIVWKRGWQQASLASQEARSGGGR
jgi:membrane protease YdiL (CAAX protease family)